MPVAPFTAQQLDTAQAIFRGEVQQALGYDKERPLPKNLSAVDRLTGQELLVFRGRKYIVRHVGFAEGARLSVLESRYANRMLKDNQIRARRMAGEVMPLTVKETLDILEDTVTLFRDLVKPKSLPYRLLWPFLSNPFDEASEKEVGELLGFFFICRMRSTVKFLSPRGHLGVRRNRSTLETSLQPS
jgi:hypothetical protein